MSRVSMAEWKPETVYTKLQRGEQAILEIDEKLLPLLKEKMILEEELSIISASLTGVRYPDEEYREIVKKRSDLTSKKFKVEYKLMDIKKEKKKILASLDSAKMDLQKKPNDLIKSGLLELRDKYLSFAADTTRVSSMRAMSSRFVEEIQSILGLIP